MDDLGKNLRLSGPRRLVSDLLHFARKIPSVPVQRVMPLAAVVEQRRLLVQPISWLAIFTKAFARAAEEFPELRRAYMAYPWAHLYEHPHSIASIAVERLWQNERAVFFAHLRRPEGSSLRELDEHIRRFRDEPVEAFGLFRRALRLGRLPGPVRRLAWWLGLNASGYKRAKRMGTFGVSVYSALGAESLHPLSPLTCTLNYGVIQDDGSVAVRIIYDHRVMDGATVARALQHMEMVLLHELVPELADEPHHPAAAASVRPARSRIH